MILGNLVRNAFAFTEQGEVRVRLEADGVAIEDSGRGIAPEVVDTLFEPYVRGRDSVGAGLGLALVSRLCARQGWRVSVANRARGGVRAELRFGCAERSA